MLGDEQEADVTGRRRDHRQLEIDERGGVLDAVLVDEGVRGDARCDGDAERGADAAPVRVAPAETANQDDAEADEADPDRCPAFAPKPSTVTPTSSTSTGARPRAIG